jgi:hypothetical protein
MLMDESSRDPMALEPIYEGDHLTILDQLGNVSWKGIIRCDKEVGRLRHPLNPENDQQHALGMWVHWIQQGFKPDAWAKFFVRPDYDRLRGILVRKRSSKRDPRPGPRLPVVRHSLRIL